VGFCALAVLIGCIPLVPYEDPSWPEEVLSSTPELPGRPDSAAQVTQPSASSDRPQTAVLQHIEREPNNTWAQAELVAFDGQVQIIGSLAAGVGVKDIDLFDLGPVLAGQRLQAELTSSGGSDVQIGLLDAQGRILAYIDPTSPTAGPGHVDIVLHESSERLYVMIACRSSSISTRDYTAHISLQPDALPSPRPQIVVLAFSGAGSVRIGSRAPVDVPPFDIASVNPAFAGRTEEAIERLMDMVREDYEGLGVEFYRDSDPAAPAEGVTTIYFGTSDTRLLGLADNIDPYNSNPTQSAIIYTDTFSLFNQLNPGFEATIQVLANVASHEAGHLLGLRHTADPEDLMDVTATARQMLADQWFKTSPLHASVLPAGVQDAPAMLAWSVGGSLSPATQLKLEARRKAILPGDPEQDFYIPRSLLADCGCAECDHGDAE